MRVEVDTAGHALFHQAHPGIGTVLRIFREPGELVEHEDSRTV